MTSEKFLPYARQSIDDEAIKDIAAVLSSDIITRGPKVEEFEAAVAEYCNATYGVAFNSGTSALMAACYAADVSAIDRLITTPNTFIATLGAGLHHSMQFVFADIDPSTGNIDCEEVGCVLSQPHSRGRSVILPVHFAGVPVDMQFLDEMIKDPDVVVVEDAAHALGSCYPDGRKVGCCAWSDMTVFSFHPAKTITTGEGGMVMTNSAELQARLQRFRNNGIVRHPAELLGKPTPWYYEVQDLTGNYNFTDFQAALGLSQLQRLDRFIEKRRRLMERYSEQLANVPGVRMLTSEVNGFVAYHLCVVLVDFEEAQITRTQVIQDLKQRGIGTQVHYIPLYHHPYIGKCRGTFDASCPNMEAYYSKTLSLPLYVDLEMEDVDRVCQALKETLTP